MPYYGKQHHARVLDSYEEIPSNNTATNIRENWPERVGGRASALRTLDAEGRLKVRVSEHSTTANVFYVGLTAPGNLESEAKWQIKRITYTSPSGIEDVDIDWADGDDEFNNVWNDRQSLSYS